MFAENILKFIVISVSHMTGIDLMVSTTKQVVSTESSQR
jgi:hypothetical protein